ncbi:Steroid hormone receptor ERR2 [Microtus ochrogaster]|uniref:Steroid hormone receptor ERR2 n=1 Tax=Microtus ochrogaster TaxID=79684 RepID=A0A8J6GEM7_MICOH|nr:Steroid hormone receptor ERR2 [Microtus ochrogaster]
MVIISYAKHILSFLNLSLGNQVGFLKSACRETFILDTLYFSLPYDNKLFYLKNYIIDKEHSCLTRLMGLYQAILQLARWYKELKKENEAFVTIKSLALAIAKSDSMYIDFREAMLKFQNLLYGALQNYKLSQHHEKP